MATAVVVLLSLIVFASLSSIADSAPQRPRYIVQDDVISGTDNDGTSLQAAPLSDAVRNQLRQLAMKSQNLQQRQQQHVVDGLQPVAYGPVDGAVLLGREPRPSIGINKRHCWDVTDVCCMWSIC